MQLSDLSRIHWLMIGLLGGLLMGYMWTGTTDIEGIRNAEQARFERDLLLHDDKSGLPFIGHIVVHPAEDSPSGKVNVVLYKRLAHDKSGNVGLWLNERLMARVPYKPAVPGRVRSDPNLTITDYLTQIDQQAGGTIGFHYGWWFEPTKAMALGSVSGLLIVGGIWPTALSLVGGAGFGLKLTSKNRSKIDWASLLRRAPAGLPGSSAGSSPIVATDNTDEVTRHYEQSLAAASEPNAVNSADAARNAAQPADAQKLEGGPLESMALPVVEAEEIEVKGEFYPVVIRHTKKPE